MRLRLSGPCARCAAAARRHRPSDTVAQPNSRYRLASCAITPSSVDHHRAWATSGTSTVADRAPSPRTSHAERLPCADSAVGHESDRWALRRLHVTEGGEHLFERTSRSRCETSIGPVRLLVAADPVPLDGADLALAPPPGRSPQGLRLELTTCASPTPNRWR